MAAMSMIQTGNTGRDFHFQDHRLIFYQQDGFMTWGSRSPQTFVPYLLGRVRMPGQVNRKGGALSRHTVVL